MSNFIAELKRRNVVRVGVAYVVLGWVALQVGDVLFDMFEAPPWVGKSFAALLLLGFPFACLFAWAFELTPAGVKRTAEVDRDTSITPSTGRKLDRVIIVALVIALGYFVWERQGLVDAGNEPAAATASSSVIDRSIAVLPFVNMSSDEEQAWFADGLTEEILNALARTPDLLVASRTSSFQFKGQNTDISAIARTLGVAHVLEGSVRRGGDRLRVTAQLIRASDGFHLWSETFDRKPEDVIQIQEDVAFEIAKALDTAMDPEALKRMVSAGTASIPAYEAYLEGLAIAQAFGSSGNPENFGEALARYERATQIDPRFNAAHFRQALFWQTQLETTNIGSEITELDTGEILRRFATSIDAAIATSDNDALTQKFRAVKALVELRLADVAKHTEAYLSAYPNDIFGLNLLAQAYAMTRNRDALQPLLAQYAESSREDPIELNVMINYVLFTGLVDEAVAIARDVLVRYPEHAFLVYQSHRALLWAGLTEEAARLVPALERSEFRPENLLLVRLRQACAEGDRARAASVADETLSAIESDRLDASIHFIALQILGRPVEAHEFLVGQQLEVHTLASYLTYPYFNHNYFPELVRVLERQGIDRPFIDGPPYACKPPL